MKVQDRAAKSTFPGDGFLVNTQDIQALDSRIEPNYLSTYEFFIENKKRKNEAIHEKQNKKGYLAGYPANQQRAAAASQSPDI